MTDRPPPDPAKLLGYWMEWERGQTPPGQLDHQHEARGLRELLESILATRDAIAELGDDDPRSELASSLREPSAGGPQKIPRPPGARPATRRRGQGCPLTPAPRWVWRTCGGSSRASERPDGPRRAAGAMPAGVLVPLFEEDGETRVVLTRRTTTLPSHRGEVSFPGGKALVGEDLRDAALREAEEEIGLLARRGGGRGRARSSRDRGQPLRARAVRGRARRPTRAHAEPERGRPRVRRHARGAVAGRRLPRGAVADLRRGTTGVLLRARRRHGVGCNRADPLPVARADHRRRRPYNAL